MFTQTYPSIFLPPLPFYFMPPPNGVDDTASIAAVRSAANKAGGGLVYYQAGTYITGNQPLYNSVHDKGAGWEATILQLKAGANTDMFSFNTAGINLGAGFGGGSNNGVAWWSISDMTLDGNRANQTAGPSYLLRFVGYGYYLQNLHIRNGFSGGVQFDWNPSAPPTHYNDTRMNNVVITDCNGIGLEHNSSDGAWVNVLVGVTGSHNAHFCLNGGATNMTNCHFWGPATGTSSVCLLDESSYGVYNNCQFESSDTVQLVLLGTNASVVGGRIFSGGVGTPTGIQLGQPAGGTPYASQLKVSAGLTQNNLAFFHFLDTSIDDCTGANGALWLSNQQQNRIKLRVSQNAGTGTYFTGTFGSSDADIHGFGITPDGSAGKGGIFRPVTNSHSGIQFTDGINEFFRVDTNGQFVATPNNIPIIQYSDFYSTVAAQFNNGSLKFDANSTLFSVNGAPGAGLGNNGDFALRVDTPGTVNQRLYVKSAGTWSGIL